MASKDWGTESCNVMTWKCINNWRTKEMRVKFYDKWTI